MGRSKYSPGIKKLKRFFRKLFLFIFVIILGIVCVKTLTFNSRQIITSPAEVINIDDAVIQRLAEVTRIPTVSYPERIDTTAFLAFRNYLANRFPLVDSLLEKTTVNEYSLVYKWAGKNPRLEPILLLGHIDVVPVEKESWGEWTQPPYSGAISDGYIWGRGTLDDKVSILGALEAFDLLLRENYQPERSIYLACGHDEEIGGNNGAKAIARRFAQQGIQFEYVIDEGMLIINDALPGLSQPVALIGTAEKGYTTLQMTVNLADGGHSSMPPPETAIGLLSKAVNRLEQHPFPAKIDGPTQLLFDYAGPEMSLPMKAVFANLWLTKGLIKKQLAANPSTNAVLRTTIAPTIIQGGIKENVLPTSASASINFRISPGETTQSVMEHVRKAIDDERISIHPLDANFSNDPSPVSDVDAFGYKVIEKTAREVFPEVIAAPALVLAATDSRHYESVTKNTYRFMPIPLDKSETKRIHGIDERIEIEAYKNMIRFYRQLIKNSCR